MLYLVGYILQYEFKYFNTVSFVKIQKCIINWEYHSNSIWCLLDAPLLSLDVLLHTMCLVRMGTFKLISQY
jgi:hypothetical protein